MFLAEVKVEIKNLEKKISQLKGYIVRYCSIDAEITDEAVNQLFELYERLRSHKIAYARLCTKIRLTIGDSDVSLTEAKIILSTMKTKLELLNELIDHGQALDALALMENRDRLDQEYTSLNNALQSIEWSTKID